MRASARALHLYAPVAVCRRPSSETMDAAAPPARARALRQVAAAVIRCALPSAARWHRLPDAAGRVSPSALPEAWQGVADDALRASRRGDVEAAGHAAAALSELAGAGRMPLAAAMLAEAAALCAWDDPLRALRVATLARDRADHPATEWWGLRAASVAARAGEWAVAVSAWARVGDSRRAREDWRAALVAARREARAGKRSRNQDLYARALHTLASVNWVAGHRTAALKIAGRVCKLYSTTHPRLPGLAHDVAVFQMQQGDAAGAVPIFRAVLSIFESPRDRLIAGVHLAMAAATARDWTAHQIGVEAVLVILESSGYGDGAAWALAELAPIEAEHTENFTRAHLWAKWALTIAIKRGERGPEKTARSVLRPL